MLKKFMGKTMTNFLVGFIIEIFPFWTDALSYFPNEILTNRSLCLLAFIIKESLKLFYFNQSDAIK
jgi:hypothetical protein